MPRGTPDWGEYAVQELVPKGFDVNELAPRLGSMCIWSRTGTVYYLEDFSRGVYGWNRSVVDTDLIILSKTYALFSPVCCRFWFKTASTNAAYITRSFPLFADTPVGIEIFPLFSVGVNKVSIQTKIYYGGYEYNYGVQLDRVNDTINVFNGSSDWTPIYSPLKLNQPGRFYHDFKVIMDFKAERYRQMCIDNRIIDLSPYIPYSVATSYSDGMEVFIVAVNGNDTDSSVWVGGLIITQNE